MSISISSDKSVRETYEVDASGLHLLPDLVARPESIDDVMELVRKAASDRIPITCAGARTFRYGATRRHVRALKVVMASGELIEFRRSDLEKNTVGYAFAHDPIDWFIGSEGTLGIIVEAELSLLSLPHHVVGLAVLFRTEREALNFVIATRESSTLSARCIEYFDGCAIEIARSAASAGTIPADTAAMVYVEEEINDDLDSTLTRWIELIEAIAADFEHSCLTAKHDSEKREEYVTPEMVILTRTSSLVMRASSLP